MVPGPTASVASECLREMWIPGSPRTMQSKTQGVKLSSLCLHKTSGEFWCTLQFNNHCPELVFFFLHYGVGLKYPLRNICVQSSLRDPCVSSQLDLCFHAISDGWVNAWTVSFRRNCPMIDQQALSPAGEGQRCHQHQLYLACSSWRAIRNLRKNHTHFLWGRIMKGDT